MALSFPSVALGFGAGLVVAFGFTLLVGRDAPARASSRDLDDAPDEQDVPEDATDEASASGGVNPVGSGVPAGTTAQLRAEVARLTKELAVEKQRRESAEGKPIPFPADVPERHTEKGLMTSVRAALAELKLGGDVTAIDCTEYPCLASVRVQGAFDLERFLKAPALTAYAGDQPAYSATSFPDGENVLVVGFSEATQLMVKPDDPAHDEKSEQFRAQLASERERRSGRVRAMFQAGLDEMPPRPAP